MKPIVTLSDAKAAYGRVPNRQAATYYVTGVATNHPDFAANTPIISCPILRILGDKLIETQGAIYSVETPLEESFIVDVNRWITRFCQPL